jgi:hypothetical protein
MGSGAGTFGPTAQSLTAVVQEFGFRDIPRAAAEAAQTPQ